MSSFNPKKLSVTYLPPANYQHPIIGRKYTLTHSDQTGELFLAIGYKYDKEAINWKMRDEVLAEWQDNLYLLGIVYVDGGDFSEDEAAFRFAIFQKEMSTALKGIVNGDRSFYDYYPYLLQAPIYICFQSAYPAFRKTLYYDTPNHYLH